MGVIEVIDQVAEQLGIPPILAVAIAEVESGLNPLAVGDQGTSYGLFQLHRGGELGSLTPQQAFDPQINAEVALRQFQVVMQEHPGLDPGWVAALAERPADPATYAAAVDREIQTLQAQGMPSTSTLSSGPGNVGAAAAAVASAIGTGLGSGLSGAAGTVGHGLADAAAATWSDLGTFASRNLVALLVAAVVVLVLFL